MIPDDTPSRSDFLQTLPWPPPLPNLPTLFSDETLYSWSGFVHASNANTDARVTSRQLFGAPYSALLHDFPAHLDTLDQNLDHVLGHPRELALRHTLLGYFLPVISQSASSEILAGVCNGAESHLKFKLGIAASRVGAHHPLKGCPQCFDEDEKHRGRAYWRVQHQYPSTLICTRHRCSLDIAWDPTTPVHRRGWILPRMGLNRQWTQIAQLAKPKLDILGKLADFSEQWAAQEPSSLNLRTLALTYQAALEPRGHVTKAGSLRLTSLSTEIRSHYATFECLPGLQVLKSVRSDWPGFVGSIARSSPRNGHPLKHLLLITMLFESWSEFLTTYQNQSEMIASPEAPFPHKESAPNENLANFRMFVLNDGISVSAAAAKVGVTTSTGVRWAKLLGIPFTSRAKRLSAPILSKVRALLRAGLDKSDVIEQGAITSVSLNRLISAEPNVAQAWRSARHAAAMDANRTLFTRAINEHPGWTIKQLRSLPGNGFMWLYRHDREWLLEHMPAIWHK